MTPHEAAPFIVHALPRSRTAWMSAFLSYGAWRCYHEQAIYMRSVADIKALFGPCVGTAETAAYPAAYLVRQWVPDLREVVVTRPVEDVVQSVMRKPVPGFTWDETLLRQRLIWAESILRKISARPGVLTLNQHDLDTEDGCAVLFERCLPYDFDRGWWLSLKDRNIQADIGASLRYFHENRSEIDAFKALLKREMFRARRAELRAA